MNYEVYNAKDGSSKGSCSEKAKWFWGQPPSNAQAGDERNSMACDKAAEATYSDTAGKSKHLNLCCCMSSKSPINLGNNKHDACKNSLSST